MRQPATTFLILFLFISFGTTNLSAQSTLDLLLLEDAEKAYAAAKYSETISKINQLQDRGVKGPKILHLKIMANQKLFNQNLVEDFEYARDFKRDVDTYLTDYDNPDFITLYREVYEVSKWMQNNKQLFDDEAFFYSSIASNKYMAKNYSGAFKLYRRAAEKGNILSVRSIAKMYRLGHGVEKDGAGALEWNTKAGIAGDADAQFYLGYSYSTGRGTAKNFAEALKWYTMAAEKGYTAAQNNLGTLYAGGKGTPINHVKAVEWFTKAAEQGDTYAQNNLADLLMAGIEGVPKNVSKAIE